MFHQQQAGQPSWMWSQHHQQHYYYDQTRGQCVFWDGTVVNVPRPMATETIESLQRPTPQAPTAFPTYEYNHAALNAPHNGDAFYHSYTADPARRQPSFGSPTRDFPNDLPTSEWLASDPRGGNPPHRQRVAFDYVSEAYDPTTQAKTAVLTERQKNITDQELLKEGGATHRIVLPRDEDVPLDHRFKFREARFFVIGRVFLILWAEPARESNGTGVSYPTMISGTLVGSGRYGQPVHQKVRRFVVVREGEQSCTALPIGTYNNQGVSKDRVTKSDHAIVYSTKTPPTPLEKELPERGEEGMRTQPIRVVPDMRDDKLDSMSRIDFGKPHTVHHNLKVRAFGMVAEKSMNDLLNQFRAVLLEGLFSRKQAGLVRKDSTGRYERANALQRANAGYQSQAEARAHRLGGLKQQEGGDVEGDSSGGEDDYSGSEEEEEEE